MFCAIAIVKSFQPTTYQSVNTEKLFENVFCRIKILGYFSRFQLFWSISATLIYLACLAFETIFCGLKAKMTQKDQKVSIDELWQNSNAEN